MGIGSSLGMGAFMSGREHREPADPDYARSIATIFVALSLTLALMNRGTTQRGRRFAGKPASGLGQGDDDDPSTYGARRARRGPTVPNNLILV